MLDHIATYVHINCPQVAWPRVEVALIEMATTTPFALHELTDFLWSVLRLADNPTDITTDVLLDSLRRYARAVNDSRPLMHR